MKNKILILLAIAAFVLASCGDDDKGGKTCTYKSIGGHGLSDGLTNDKGNCGKDDCAGLKSYGKVAGREIYRNGSTNDTNFTDGKIQAFANTIDPAYSATENVGNIPLHTWVEILKDGKHSYNVDAGALKFFIDGELIQKWLNDQAKPADCEYLADGHGIRDGLTNDTGVCGKTGCIGLKDYRPANAQVEPNPYDVAAPGDYFPWPIYRVGALTVSNYPDTILDDTVNSILAGYKLVVPTDKTRLNSNDCGLAEIHVTYNAPGGKYTWTGTELGIQTGLLGGNVRGFLEDIALGAVAGPDDDLPHVTPIVQLMPTATGNVRLANSKKKTEQFPVIAGGADKDPKVNTVAQNFKLIRQAIARNNRNVKVYSCT